MKYILTALSFLAVTKSNAQNAGDTCMAPNRNSILGLCLAVSEGKEIDPVKNNGFRFLYEKRLWQLACAVKGVDSDESAKKKIQEMWLKYREKCGCDVSGFNVPSGNVLKLSVDATFTRFIKEMGKKYEVDMNFIDPADGMTIMDYLQIEIEAAKRSGSFDKLAELGEIYNLLRSKNTRHRHEMNKPLYRDLDLIKSELEKLHAEVSDKQIIYKNGKDVVTYINMTAPDEFMYSTQKYSEIVTFDVKEMNSISEASESFNLTSGSPVGFIRIELSSKKAWRSFDDATNERTVAETETIFLPYLKSSPDAFDNIKNAWLRFKELRESFDKVFKKAMQKKSNDHAILRS